MPAVVLDILTLAAVATLLWAPTRVALGLLMAAVLLVPAPLRVPHAHSSYLTVLHVVVLAALARLVVRWVDGRLDPRLLRVTPVHYAGVLFFVVVFAVGVMFVHSPGPLASAGLRLADLAAQAGFFVAVLAMIRELDDIRLAATLAAGAAALAGVVAVVEHATGSSWGHWLFSSVPGAGVFDAAQQLDQRGGQPRVRAGAEFALQFGWLIVTLLPFVVVATLRARRRAALVPAGLVLAVTAVYWSFTRSALVGVGATLLVVALVARERRATWLALAAISASAAAVIVHPAFLTHVSREVDTGSINVRFERVAPILGRVAAHPFRGLGLGNLLQSGFATTDNAYLLQYTEVGAVGVAALAVLFLVALAQCVRGLAALDDDDRLVAGACVAAVIAYIASTVFYDAFTLLQGPLLLWLAVAIGTVAAEGSAGPARLPRPKAAWVGATAAVGVGVGFAVALLSPARVGEDALFTTMPVTTEAGRGDPILSGAVLVGTVCDVARLQNLEHGDVHVGCRAEPVATGYGRLRVEAPSAAGVATALGALERTVRGRIGDRAFRVFPLGAPSRSVPSVLVTAPAWLPIGAVGLLVLVPWRRRRQPGQPDDEAGDRAAAPEHRSDDPTGSSVIGAGHAAAPG